MLPGGAPLAAVPLLDPVPSLATFLRAVRRDLTAGEGTGCRHGHQSACAHDVFATRRRMWRNEVWEADHVQAPLRVDADGTLVHPFVTWFIDCATKAITGLAVTPGTPTGASVLAALRSAIVPTALTRANMELLREEIIQVDELITKCETDLDSLTDSDRATVESWIHSRDRFVAVIPVAAALAGRALRVSAVEAKHTWT